MARDIVINGETMVFVKGGAHLSGRFLGDLSELGLSVDQIMVYPRYYHQDMKIDSYGQFAPADVISYLAECMIVMNLIHYDTVVLDLCMKEAIAGNADFFTPAGIVGPAGQIMGKNIAPFNSGCRYIALGLTSPVQQLPWLFPTCYLAEQPAIIPLGNNTSIARLSWRAIPYATAATISGIGAEGGQIDNQEGEIISSGLVLWDNIDIRDLIVNGVRLGGE